MSHGEVARGAHEVWLLGLLTALCGCYLVHGPEEGTPAGDGDGQCPKKPSPTELVAVTGRAVWFVDAQGGARVVHSFEGRPDLDPISATSSVASDGRYVVVAQAVHPASYQGQGTVELAVLCSDGRRLTARTLEDVSYRNALRAQAFVRDGRVAVGYGSQESAHALLLLLPGSERAWTAPFALASAPDADGTVLAVAREGSAVAFHWVASDGSGVPTRYLSDEAGTPKVLDDALVWPAPRERRVYVETASSLEAIELPTLSPTYYLHSGSEPVTGGWMMFRDSKDLLHRVHVPTRGALPSVLRTLPEGLEYTVRWPEPAIDAQGRIFVVLKDNHGAALFITEDGREWTRASPWHTGTASVQVRQAAGSYLVWGSDPAFAGPGTWEGRPAEDPVREGEAFEVVRPDEDIYWELPRSWASGQLPYSRYQLASDGRAVSFWSDDRLFVLEVATGRVIATDVTYSVEESLSEHASPSKVSTFIPGPDVVIGD